MDDQCSCSQNPEDDDEDTSSLEPDFLPANIETSIGHRYTSQESAMMAFEKLGLRPKNDDRIPMDKQDNL